MQRNRGGADEQFSGVVGGGEVVRMHFRNPCSFAENMHFSGLEFEGYR